MHKLFYKYYKSVWFIIYFLMIAQLIVRFFLVEENKTAAIDQWLIMNNTITMLINTAYLLYSYKVIYSFQTMRNSILLRIGEEKMVVKAFQIAIHKLVFYFVATYGILFVINIHSVNSLLIFCFYIALTILLFIGYELLFIYIIFNDQANKYVILPFIINIAVHYILMPWLIF